MTWKWTMFEADKQLHTGTREWIMEVVEKCGRKKMEIEFSSLSPIDGIYWIHCLPFKAWLCMLSFMGRGLLSAIVFHSLLYSSDMTEHSSDSMNIEESRRPSTNLKFFYLFFFFHFKQTREFEKNRFSFMHSFAAEVNIKQQKFKQRKKIVCISNFCMSSWVSILQGAIE